MPGPKPGALPLGDVPIDVVFCLVMKVEWVLVQDRCNSLLALRAQTAGALPLGDVPMKKLSEQQTDVICHSAIHYTKSPAR